MKSLSSAINYELERLFILDGLIILRRERASTLDVKRRATAWLCLVCKNDSERRRRPGQTKRAKPPAGREHKTCRKGRDNDIPVPGPSTDAHSASAREAQKSSSGPPQTPTCILSCHYIIDLPSYAPAHFFARRVYVPTQSRQKKKKQKQKRTYVLLLLLLIFILFMALVQLSRLHRRT